MFLALALLVAADPEPAPLAKAIDPIAAAHKGKIAVYAKHLGTGQELYARNADEPMPTASLIKTAVLVEAYCQHDEKKTPLDRTVTLTKDDKVPGSGILTYHFSDGATFPLRDAVRLMVVYSDNTATNLTLDQVGIRNVNARMESFGLKETKIHSKVYKRSTTTVDPKRSEKYGLGSTTAREMATLMELIHANKAASAESCKEMMTHLKANDDKDMLVRFLPDGTVAAHKTGSVSNARTDAGILFVPAPGDRKKLQPVAVCVLTDENGDQRYAPDNAAQVIIGRVGKAVYEHFGK
jgi:beta-lactamase class A